MSLRTFFRPTPWTVTVTLICTGIAAVALYYILLCALNGDRGCMAPLPLQVLLVVIMWPWAAAIRLFGTANIAIGSIVGIVISGLWLFALVCCGRGVVTAIRKRKADARSQDTLS